MITYIVRLLKTLNGNGHPGEIAHATSCGLLLGFLPKDNLLWYVIFLLFLFLRINKGAFFLFILLGSFLTMFFDPLFDSIGYTVLKIPDIAPFMASFLNIPFMAFTKLNNSVVVGSLLCALAVYIPLYFFSRGFVYIWRKTLSPMLSNNKLVKWFFRVPLVQRLYNAYVKLESLS
ncbi:MAG: TIGR03546 family protein [Spirochaetales bacterium]